MAGFYHFYFRDVGECPPEVPTQGIAGLKAPRPPALQREMGGAGAWEGVRVPAEVAADSPDSPRGHTRLGQSPE